MLIVFCCLYAIRYSSCTIYGNKPDTIIIGMLTQDKSSAEAVNGAALAAGSANSNSGKSGIYFHIEARSMEGPWGTGAKETVGLVFNDASVLIVSADGRNSHLAEQVSAKTQVPMISVQSSDPTLAQAFIPWFFSCVPDDNIQAQTLLDAINKKGYKKPLVISDNSYDNKMQASAFMKTAKTVNPNLICLYTDDYPERAELIKTVKNNDPDCIMLFMKPASAAGIISGLNRIGVKPALFGSLSFCRDIIPGNLLFLLEGMTLVSPGYLFSTGGREFTGSYIERYGTPPSYCAAAAYDAVNAFIKCFTGSPAGCSGLKEKLAKTSMEGITGKFGFDTMGNRTGSVELMTIKGGHFVQN